MATTKKSSTAKRTYRKRNTKKNSNYDPQLIRLLVILGFLVISIFLFLCNYSWTGKVGNFISSFFFGLFGWAEYIFPFVLFYMLINRIIGVRNRKNLFRFIAVIVLFIILGMSAELINGNSLQLEKYSFVSIYKFASSQKHGGGIIMGSLAYFLHAGLDTAGSILIIVFIALVALMLLLGDYVFVIANYIKNIKKPEFGLNLSEEEANSIKERREQRKQNTKKRLEDLRKNADYDEYTDIDTSSFEVPVITQKKPEKINKSEIAETERILSDSSNKKKDFFEETDMRKAVPASREIHEITFDNNEYSDEEDQDFSTSHVVNLKASTSAKPVIQTYIPEEKPSPEESDEYLINTEPAIKPVEVKKPVANTEIVPPPVETSIKATEVQQKPYMFPNINLLKKGLRGKTAGVDELQKISEELEDTLLSFGVAVKVTNVTQGPSVTRYEMEPERGVKVSKIVSLADDLKLALRATDIRIEAPIPGKSAVGIEVPNTENQTIMVRDMIEGEAFKQASSKLSFTVGKDIGGKDVIFDVAKMPHLLIAGTTGSGKSVFINTIIMSILYKATPEEVNLIMVDPKVVELSVYNGIPHLMYPVITDPQKASGVLKWCVKEMENRYKKFAELGVRDLAGYNEKVKSLTETEHYVLPKIVIVIDELADLMMVCAKEVEESICRLAQLARACGMHLIVATQRPSTDVITGLIKANMPSRCALSVSSGIDSRTIIDMVGAEKLLGHGDMLFYPTGYPKPVRLQGAYVSDDEISKVVEFLKDQNYHNARAAQESVESIDNSLAQSSDFGSSSGSADGNDPLFFEAGLFVIESGNGSIGSLQRKFKIGFNRAARIMDQLCEAGAVANAEGTKPRQIIMTLAEFNSKYNA